MAISGQRGLLLALACGAALLAQNQLPFEPIRARAISIKVGEPTQTTAIVWMRVPPTDETPIRRRKDLRGILAGLFDTAPDHLVRLRYATSSGLEGAVDTGWEAANFVDDYTARIELEDLEPGQRYWFEVAAAYEDESPLYEPRRGTFQTAPSADDDRAVSFTVITGQAYHHLDAPEGFQIYQSMLRLAPDFLVATGDSVYYDRGSMTVRSKEEAREHWRRMYQLPRLLEFHAATPVYYEKDDHDLHSNDYWPGRNRNKMGELSYQDGLDVFAEQNPVPETPYRTIRWGRSLQIWLTEVREFRSPNTDPDGPDKTIFGERQLRWLKRTLAESDVEWKILINPTPIVGPDRAQKGDNHANTAFETEGAALRRDLAALGERFVLIAGDRHWQYHSVDPETGLGEFGCGPASDPHAGGSPGFERDYHRFHRVAGGFLSVSVAPRAEGGHVVVRHHSVDGEVVYEQTLPLSAD